MYKRRLLGSFVIVLAVLLFVGLIIPTSYVLVMPGEAENLSQMVDVEEESTEGDGSFFLVTVKRQQANLLLLLYGLLHPNIDVTSEEQVIPPGLDEEEYRELLQEWMEESQFLAKIIALQEAGYDVDIKGEGIRVHDFENGSPAKELLQKGDIILEVDGQEVRLADEVIAKVQNRKIGDTVNLTIQRNQKIKEFELNTTRHPEEPGKPALGILISAINWDAELPLNIDIDAGAIGGPSAGMMFVLEILNQLNHYEDISRGYSIAGTGTININKEVGSIGGVKHKVKAAENASAAYFLVPEDNYDQAIEAADKIEIVPVSTFDEVIEFLKTLNKARVYPCFICSFQQPNNYHIIGLSAL